MSIFYGVLLVGAVWLIVDLIRTHRKHTKTMKLCEEYPDIIGVIISTETQKDWQSTQLVCADFLRRCEGTMFHAEYERSINRFLMFQQKKIFKV